MIHFSKLWRQFMRGMLVLVWLIVLTAYPAMAAAPGDKGAKELAAGQKQTQEKPALPRPPEGSMVSIPAGGGADGNNEGAPRLNPAHKAPADVFCTDVFGVTAGQETGL